MGLEDIDIERIRQAELKHEKKIKDHLNIGQYDSDGSDDGDKDEEDDEYDAGMY